MPRNRLSRKHMPFRPLVRLIHSQNFLALQAWASAALRNSHHFVLDYRRGCAILPNVMTEPITHTSAALGGTDPPSVITPSGVAPFCEDETMDANIEDVLFAVTVEDVLRVAKDYVGDRELTDAEKATALAAARDGFGQGYICGDWWDTVFDAFSDTDLPTE